MSSIPLVDLHAQYRAIADEIAAALSRVLDRQMFVSGHEVASFEQEFAHACGAPECIGVSNGTSAIELALTALGIGPGDEVITVSHTFIATVEAIAATGATPVFVDIEPQSWTMDPLHVAEAVTERTKAIVPVHIYGHPANVDAIASAAPGIPIVEDAAQAHLARYHGFPVGTLAAAATYSFYPGKNLGAYGDAGGITTHDPELAVTMRALRDHGRAPGAKYEHELLGSNMRMDELQAAILRAKLPRLRSWTDARQAIASRYDESLARFAVRRQVVQPWADHVRHLYVLCHPERDELLGELRSNGINAGVHYPIPVHLQPALTSKPERWRIGRYGLEVTEDVAATCLTLPLYAELDFASVDRVVETLGSIGSVRDITAHQAADGVPAAA